MRTTLSSLPWFALTALIFFAPPVPGQDTATLTGTIRDQSGASIPAAAVAITNTSTGMVRQLKSNSDGEYVAAALPPGTYNVAVTAPGFHRYQALSCVLPKMRALTWLCR